MNNDNMISSYSVFFEKKFRQLFCIILPLLILTSAFLLFRNELVFKILDTQRIGDIFESIGLIDVIKFFGESKVLLVAVLSTYIRKIVLYVFYRFLTNAPKDAVQLILNKKDLQLKILFKERSVSVKNERIVIILATTILIIFPVFLGFYMGDIDLIVCSCVFMSILARDIALLYKHMAVPSGFLVISDGQIKNGRMFFHGGL